MLYIDLIHFRSRFINEAPPFRPKITYLLGLFPQVRADQARRYLAANHFNGHDRTSSLLGVIVMRSRPAPRPRNRDYSRRHSERAALAERSMIFLPYSYCAAKIGASGVSLAH